MQPSSSGSDLTALQAAVAQWRSLGDRYAADLAGAVLADSCSHDGQRAQAIALLLNLGALQEARHAVLAWLLQWRAQLPARLAAEADPASVANPALWAALADVSERCGDPQLPELFWQSLETLRPAPPTPGVLPLLGVPILNGAEHLLALLASLDQPVQTLAIVDQSGGRHDPASIALRQALARLEREGMPGVERLVVARPFSNIGVAAAWNLILRSFPEAPIALIVNHDVQLAPGVLGQALARLDASRPQFLPLLPAERAYSAFLLTALAWDAMGLFDERFYPAYCEDLDHRDRLLACPQVERLEGGFAYGPMLEANPRQSATLSADPALQEQNRRSFALNRLWYLHRRRGPGSALIRSGEWRQRWLSRWI